MEIGFKQVSETFRGESQYGAAPFHLNMLVLKTWQVAVRSPGKFSVYGFYKSLLALRCSVFELSPLSDKFSLYNFYLKTV